MSVLGEDQVDPINGDVQKAFEQAVAASQPNLSLHHLVTIIGDLRTRIEELEEKVGAEEEETPKPKAKKAKSRKTSSKKSKKSDSDNDDDDE